MCLCDPLWCHNEHHLPHYYLLRCYDGCPLCVPLKEQCSKRNLHQRSGVRWFYSKQAFGWHNLLQLISHNIFSIIWSGCWWWKERVPLVSDMVCTYMLQPFYPLVYLIGFLLASKCDTEDLWQCLCETNWTCSPSDIAPKFTTVLLKF